MSQILVIVNNAVDFSSCSFAQSCIYNYNSCICLCNACTLLHCRLLMHSWCSAMLVHRKPAVNVHLMYAGRCYRLSPATSCGKHLNPPLSVIHPGAAGHTPLHPALLCALLLLSTHLAPPAWQTTAQAAAAKAAQSVNPCCVGLLLHIIDTGISEHLLMLSD